MRIRLLITGGTIEKQHDPISEQLLLLRTHFPDMLKQSRSTLKLVLQKVLFKDSLYTTEADRQKILHAALKAPEKHILITHGTSTMDKTAQALGKGVAGKVIVMFGALVPYSLQNSDAQFNFGCAIIAVQTFPPGVYVAMNGKVFAWNNVRKNFSKGIFEKIKR